MQTPRHYWDPEETERTSPLPDTWLSLLGQDTGLCDPGLVTEPFCPLAEKGSLMPESNWGSMAKRKSLHPLGCFSLHVAQERGAGSVIQSLEKKEPSPPATT